MKNIIITGGLGFFGTNFNSQFNEKLNIYLIGRKNNPKIRNSYFIDLKNTTELKKFIYKKNIDTIIHAAAITDVDYCEKNKKECFEVNTNLAIKLSKLSKQCKVKFIFLSSDQLFNRNTKSKKENAITKPINNYGKSKVMAEIGILKNNNKALILRTNFFGFAPKYKKSFSDWIIFSLKNKKKISLYQDIYFNPLYIKFLNNLLVKLSLKGSNGIYNATSDNKISKFQFGIKIAKKFNLNLKMIEKSKFDIINHVAKRPKNMCLDNYKIKKELNLNKISLDSQFNEMLKDL